MNPTPENRSKILDTTRNLKMAQSAHAYVRGNTQKFYEWLQNGPGNLPMGPSVWICGDCHVGNLGPIADAKGRVQIQIRDLDQTVIGNPAHDLIRLGLSLASAARSSDLPGVITARIVEELVVGYQEALAGDFESLEDKSYHPKQIQALLARSTRRRWRHLAEERLETVKPTIPLGKRFWTLTPEERAALGQMFADQTVRSTIAGFRGRAKDDLVQLLDAAYWMKGCSSLGRLRYAAILRLGRGKDSSLCLVDVKEGASAAAPRAANVAMPSDNAVRVVTGAKALSPNLGERMLAAKLLGKAVLVRELMPQDLKIEIDQLTHEEAKSLARYLAAVVGRAHGRQMKSSQRRAWRSQLSKNHKVSLDAPSWLWTSVVELLSLHEAAYLDHCRRYVLSESMAPA
jgi:uncharacterized protein (DUF2252 family)